MPEGQEYTPATPEKTSPLKAVGQFLNEKKVTLANMGATLLTSEEIVQAVAAFGQRNYLKGILHVIPTLLGATAIAGNTAMLEMEANQITQPTVDKSRPPEFTPKPYRPFIRSVENPKT